MSPRSYDFVVIFDNQNIWIIVEEVSLWIDDSFITLASFKFTAENLAWCFLRISDFTLGGSTD